MPTRYKSARDAAYKAQGGRCCYCNLPMWRSTPQELAPLGLRPKTATPLRCTAEHLVARQDGGGNARSNISAACWLCNVRRHRRKNPPAPEAYREFVQRKMAKGTWHPVLSGKGSNLDLDTAP